MPIENPEQAQFVINLRLKIQENKDNGRPEYEGITREEVARIISILRGNRLAHAAKTKGKKGDNIAPLDDKGLEELFN